MQINPDFFIIRLIGIDDDVYSTLEIGKMSDQVLSIADYTTIF
jgi:hypothetical protein